MPPIIFMVNIKTSSQIYTVLNLCTNKLYYIYMNPTVNIHLYIFNNWDFTRTSFSHSFIIAIRFSLIFFSQYFLWVFHTLTHTHTYAILIFLLGSFPFLEYTCRKHTHTLTHSTHKHIETFKKLHWPESTKDTSKFIIRPTTVVLIGSNILEPNGPLHILHVILCICISLFLCVCFLCINISPLCPTGLVFLALTFSSDGYVRNAFFPVR